MRQIGEFTEERQAYLFSQFLLREGVENFYEGVVDHETKVVHYQVWVKQEEHLPLAKQWHLEFKQHPEDPRFGLVRSEEEGVTAPILVSTPQKIPPLKIKVHLKPQNLSFPLTQLFLLICSLLFFWSSLQKSAIEKTKGKAVAELATTSVQQALLFDYPKAFQSFEELLYSFQPASLEAAEELFDKEENSAIWGGVLSLFVEKGEYPAAPLFEKIREGQFWRLFTPALLHHDVLHILFNMGWLWFLGKQIEKRVGIVRMLVLILLVGIFANVAQYLMSGPLFMGFSGIIFGMVGFIWVRQKVAPWEGYPLDRTTSLLLLIFLVGMLILGVVSSLLTLFSIIHFPFSIGNTAHLTGALTGMAMARISLFSREAQ